MIDERVCDVQEADVLYFPRAFFSNDFSPSLCLFYKRDDTTIHRVYVGMDMDMDMGMGLHVDFNRPAGGVYAWTGEWTLSYGRRNSVVYDYQGCC